MKLPNSQYAINEKSHKYTIVRDDGTTVGPLKSVTGIVGILDKPALIGWAAREAAEYFKGEILRMGKGALNATELEKIAEAAKGAHRRKATAAADLGTMIHAAFFAIIQGQDPGKLPVELNEPIRQFKDWRLQTDIELVGLELAVASEQHMFGGRLDAVGWSPSRGGFGIVDYKSSSGFFGNEYAYQVAGYAIAMEEQYGIDINWAEIARFSKKEPFDCEVRSVIDLKNARQGFLNLRYIVGINSESLIGQPVFSSAGVTSAPKKDKPAESPVGF